MKRLLIKGGRLVNPGEKAERVGNLLLEYGVIKSRPRSTARLEAASSTRVIDAAGMVVAPGLVDLNTFLGEPGFEYKETILTGTKAAAAGGFTSIVAMPNTVPVNDSASVTEYILLKARTEGVVRIHPLGAITRGLGGETLADIGEMYQAGCVGVTDNLAPTRESRLMRLGMEYASAFGLPVFADCQDPGLIEGGAMNEGMRSAVMGLRGMPAASEEIFVARNIALAELAGARLHVMHVSTERAVRLIRAAKARGRDVTADTAPHYFTLTEGAVEGYDTLAKTYPPLRTERDTEAIKEALADGTIDAIVSCHSPHSEDDVKVEFDLAPFGISSLETVLPLSLALVREGVLSMTQLLGKLSAAPSAIIGVEGGSLRPGSPADIVVFDESSTASVDPSLYHSRGANTPFGGRDIAGVVMYTIVGGEVVYGDS